MSSKSVLVVGGSGYLGQHLVKYLTNSGFKVYFTYLSNDPQSALEPAIGFKVNYVSGEGLQQCLDSIGNVGCVINVAGMTSPPKCQGSPDQAKAANVPSELVKAVKKQWPVNSPIFIQFSTDQVYKGDQQLWTESQACEPINIYGQTKLQGEQLVLASFDRCAVLRSSLIYGPETPFPVGRDLFVQFVDKVLRTRQTTKFFVDEYRNPVFVDDLCEACLKIINSPVDSQWTKQAVINAGGPQRLNRVDMAHIIAKVGGYSTDVIEESYSAGVRSYPSPLDISMTVDQFKKLLERELITFEQGVKCIK